MSYLKNMIPGILSLLVGGLFSTALAQEPRLYIGTYTEEGGNGGIQTYDFNKVNGSAGFLSTIKMSNPSFLARKGNVLYAVNEGNSGMVTAVDLTSGQVLNSLSTSGAHPCHVAISPSMPVLAVSNYSGGSLALYSLQKDGRLDKQEDFVHFQGSSINKDRQRNSHIHSAFFSADGSRLFVSDLGADLIYIYAVDRTGDKFALRRIDAISVKPGGGPRHLVLTADEKIIYSVLELTGELEVLKQGASGTWKSMQVLPIFDKGFVGEQGASDVKMSADGRYVYAANRGDANVITCYEVKKDHSLRVKSVNPTGGISPRNLNISADGAWLFATNQVSNTITVFKRDKKSGSLKAADGATIAVSKPVCVIF